MPLIQRLIGMMAAGLLVTGPSMSGAATGPWPAATGLTATGGSATSAESNPAGMALLERPEAVAQLVILGTDSSSTVSATSIAGTSEDDSNGIYAIPSFYYARPLSDRLAVGISLIVPAGFGDEYDDDAPSRYLATEWSLAYVALTPALSYRLNDQWSVGAGLALNYSRLSFENAVFNGLIEEDGEMELEADGFAVSYKLGVLWEGGAGTRLGLSYRSKVDTELEGEPDFSGLTDATRDRLTTAGLLDRDVELGGKLPSVVTFGAYQRLANGWDLAADLAYVQWSEFQLVESSFVGDRLIQRGSDYEDVWAGSLGVSMPLAPRWRMGLGAGYMDSPIDPEDRSFGFRIDESWIVGIGLQRQLDNHRSLEINLNYLDMGDGAIVSEEIDVIGVIDSRYDTNRGLMLDVQFQW